MPTPESPQNAPELPGVSPAERVHTAVFQGLSVLATLAGPWGVVLGGVFQGVSGARKEQRIRELFQCVENELASLNRAVAQSVAHEEAEAIAERAIVYAANEPIERKRRTFAAILAGAMVHSDRVEEHIRFVRVCEALGSFDMQVIREIMEAPNRQRAGIIMQPFALLRQNLGNPREEDLRDALHALTVQGIVNDRVVSSIGVNVTDAATWLPGLATAFGKRFVQYLRT